MWIEHDVELDGFCKHRMAIVKRWMEGGTFHVILRCRRCNDGWTRKSIVLNQDSQKGLKLVTEKFVEKDEV